MAYHLQPPTTNCTVDCLRVQDSNPRVLVDLLAQTQLMEVKELREHRFHRGLVCPHCGSDHVHGHGRYRDRRRYRCVDCGRTFNDRTGTPLSGTHYPEKWAAYLACMCLGLSLRRTAWLVDISLPTAFYWRHKLLSALRVATVPPRLEGIVELDELYVLESQKGSRYLTRPARKRGTGRSITRVPRPNRACILIGCDRRQHTVATLASMGPLRLPLLERLVDQLDFEPTALCVDNRQAYWSYSRRHQVPRKLLRHRFRGYGPYHRQNVHRYQARFRKWMSRFNGVATKYLGNYLHWHIHHYEAANHGMCQGMTVYQLYRRVHDVPVHVSNAEPLAV